MTTTTAIDFYKADHRRQYPDGTGLVYSNLTPRSDHLARVVPWLWDSKVVVFGIQGWIQEYLIDTWNSEFFGVPREQAVSRYKRRLDNALGRDSVPVEHIGQLWDHGFLPLRIKALPEGTLCPIKVPLLTIVNTDPNFFWLVNYLETAMSAELWHPITSATTALQYRRLLTYYAEETGFPKELVQFQAHDFSFRGLEGIHAAAKSGAAHLLSFTGTDTVHAIDWLEDYYHANSDVELVGASVPATEHSVMCMGGLEDEEETFRRLIEDLYPVGFVSIVSDTWDFWSVLTKILPRLKDKILAREGRVVIRPDSGDPVKILCGDPSAPAGSPARKGAVEVLWDLFGGTTTDKGYKLLDTHIGLIYGDSITLERAESILYQLKEKGFCSGNVVFGVGSFTYQFVTRDTFGMAMKATYGEVNGQAREIFKDPVTDDGKKKSAKGLLRVNYKDGTLVLEDQVSWEEEKGGALEVYFLNGQLFSQQALDTIRERITAGVVQFLQSRAYYEV